MNMLTRLGLIALAVAGSLMATAPADAQVIVHGTRQIFPGDQREITVRTENVGKRASLVQAWIDEGDKQAGPEESKAPFVLRPPVYRLDGGKSQAMRILFTGSNLPQDRESIYWLNVLDIPPAPEAGSIATGNFLQFSLRTRIKLIYRPKGLPGAVAGAPMKLEWRLVQEGRNWSLQAHNPTPYYVHFSKLGLRVQGRDYTSADTSMIAPMTTQAYALTGLSQRPVGGNVQFEYINDQGGVAAQSAPLLGE